MSDRPSRAAEFQELLRQNRERKKASGEPDPEYVDDDPDYSDEPDELVEHEDDGVPNWSINQVVSYNLAKARKAANLSQQAVAVMLGTNTNRKWSVATISAAERSWETGRIRQFNANEIVAFAKVFRLPLSYFFMPPHWDNEPQARFLMGHPESGEDDEYIDGSYPVLYGTDLLELIDPFRPPESFILEMRHAMKVWSDRDWSPSQSTYRITGTQVPPNELAALLRRTASAIEGSLRGDEPTPESPEDWPEVPPDALIEIPPTGNPADDEPASPEQLARLDELLKQIGVSDEREQLAVVNDLLRDRRGSKGTGARPQDILSQFRAKATPEAIEEMEQMFRDMNVTDESRKSAIMADFFKEWRQSGGGS